MAISSKRRRIANYYYSFFSSCLVSLLGLLAYLFLSRKVPFPSQWMTFSMENNPRFFFSGLSVHMQVGFFLDLLFSLFSEGENFNHLRWRKIKFWTNKILVMLFSQFLGLSLFLDCFRNGNNIIWGDLILTSIIIAVVNAVLELLIQFMNNYGVCNAFSLILFSDFIPYQWIKNNLITKEFIFLSLLTWLFIWFTSGKRELEIETSYLYNQVSKLKTGSKIAFGLNFSFMPMIYLSSLISLFFNIWIMRNRLSTDWGSLKSIVDNFRDSRLEVDKSKNFVMEEKMTFFPNFFIAELDQHLFRRKNFYLFNWIGLGIVASVIFIRWLAVWLQMTKSIWDVDEIAKNLKRQGIYINNVAPGDNTKKILSSEINLLIFNWFLVTTLLNLIFDNLFPLTLSGDLAFSNWFGCVNIGIGLLKQISAKYKYIKNIS